MMTRLQTSLLFFALLAGTMLACNIPVSAPDFLPAPVTPTLSGEPPTASTDVTPTRTGRPTRTPVPTDDPNEVKETETPLPTFTPISLAPTVTPLGQDASAQAPTALDEDEATKTEGTPTAESEFELLTLEFVQTWRLIPDNPGFAVANVVLTAAGGDGEYTYFRDDKQQPGSEFEYPWRACVDNVGTFRVDSRDGQSVTVDFAEKSPCE